MSTQPLPPVVAAPASTVSSTTTSTVSRIGTDWSWVIHHLILVSVLALFVAGGVYGVLDIIAQHDVARETKDSAALALIVKQSADLSTKLANDEAQSAADRVIAAARDAQQTAVIQTLAKTIQARDAALARPRGAGTAAGATTRRTSTTPPTCGSTAMVTTSAGPTPTTTRRSPIARSSARSPSRRPHRNR